MKKLIPFLFTLSLVVLVLAGLATVTGATVPDGLTNLPPLPVLSPTHDSSTISTNDAGSPSPVLTGALPFIVEFAQAHSWLAMVLFIVGLLRVIVKPLVALAHSVAEYTDTPKDNEFLAKVENSKALATVFFCLDWFGSIKLRK